MRTVLTTQIPVHRVAVFAELAWLERRPELALLCRTALDAGRRIAPATVQAALPGLSDTGAANVVAWCHQLGLCDARGGLTALGEDVAESGEAPVPEQGVYDLWLAAHPLLGQRILAAERLASTRDARFEDTRTLRLLPDRGRLYRSVANPKERFMLRDLPSPRGEVGCQVRASQAHCRLRWTLDFEGQQDQWQLDGALDAAQAQGKQALRPLQHPPEQESMDLWGLAATWGAGPLASFGRWLPEERRLAVSLCDVAETEQESFRKTLQLPEVEVPGKGVYEDVTLIDVPIRPATAADAQRWARQRFERAVAAAPAYRSRAAVRALFAELVEDTPLEPHAPVLPAHDELLATVDDNPEAFWGLAAPVDLSPRPVDAAERAPLRIGAPESAAPVISPGVLRVPYRGGWSMRQLVDRLLAGAAPRRVLLVDRYVRGEDNLATLELLVQALRDSGLTQPLQVWTGEVDEEGARIEHLTGASPRSWRDVFGRSPLHDRYLLVQPRLGPGFGWHLSNSPLHARADAPGAGPHTPLRWKDLTGTRNTAAELAPPLRHWLSGSER